MTLRAAPGRGTGEAHRYTRAIDTIRNPYAHGAGSRPPALTGCDAELDAFRVLLARPQPRRPEKSMPITGLSGAGSKTQPADALQPEAAAPDFELHAKPEQSLSLADFRGRPLVMAFYPADWSPVCSDQMALYNQVLPEFQRYGAEIVGISVDGVWSHLAFATDRNLHFPLLSDFEPKGEVARRYGVYDYETGESKRALFVLDGDGVIRWSYVSPVDVNPGADGILTALEAIAAQAPA